MNNKLYDKLIFELSRPGRRGYSLPDNGYPEVTLPDNLLRKSDIGLPEADELTVVRHYTNMSTNNFGVDTGFYPLGSCTMKYNPKINEEMAADPVIASLHPDTPARFSQGALAMYHTLASALAEIGGMAEFTLNPYAGAHGELTGAAIRNAPKSSYPTRRTAQIPQVRLWQDFRSCLSRVCPTVPLM